MALHVDYCASFGLSKEEMQAHKETIGMVLTFKSVKSVEYLLI